MDELYRIVNIVLRSLRQIEGVNVLLALTITAAIFPAVNGSGSDEICRM